MIRKITNNKKMKRIISCALVAFFCLSINAAFEKVVAGTVIPLAFVGDSVVAPFQFLGNSSNYLVAKGYKVENYSRKSWGYTQTIHKARPSALIFYVPGFCLYPFSPFANFDYFTMTDACIKILRYQKSEEGYRRKRKRY